MRLPPSSVFVATAGVLLSVATSPIETPRWSVEGELLLGEVDWVDGEVLGLDLGVEVRRDLARMGHEMTVGIRLEGENVTVASGAFTLYQLDEPFDGVLPEEAEPSAMASFRGGIGEEVEWVSVILEVYTEPSDQELHLAIVFEGEAELTTDLTAVATVFLDEDPQTQRGVQVVEL